MTNGTPGWSMKLLKAAVDAGRIVALRRDGGDQVGAGGVAARVRLEVAADAGAELLRADVVLEHAEHAAALLVGDAVERRLDVA